MCVRVCIVIITMVFCVCSFRVYGDVVVGKIVMYNEIFFLLSKLVLNYNFVAECLV